MKIEIQEIFFKDDELGVAVFNSEEDKKKYIDGYGDGNRKYFRFFKRENDVKEIELLVPTFRISENGEVVSLLLKEEVKCINPTLVDVLPHVNPSIIAIIESKLLSQEDLKNVNTIYVYVCYRSDESDCVGVCTSYVPLYKKVLSPS